MEATRKAWRQVPGEGFVWERCLVIVALSVALWLIPPAGSCGDEHPPPGATGASVAWPPADEAPVLGELLWAPHLRHRAVDDPGRHRGLGQPLEGTSWRNRPLHVGWLVGELLGDAPRTGAVDHRDALLGGYRLGWDFDHYWGSELRLAFANPELEYLDAPGPSRTGRDRFWDLDLLYYPWGDARWRPYLSAGLGLSEFYFRDAAGMATKETVFTLPYGIGVKYLAQHWLALRLALMDNWSFAAGGVDAMHQVSLDFGVEVRWGLGRPGYVYGQTGPLW